MDDSVKCPHCGILNRLGDERCRMCGKTISHEHVRGPGSIVCPHCGEVVEDGAELCNSCTMSMREVIMRNLPKEGTANECTHWSDKVSSSGRAARLMVAGVLILIAGAMGISQAVVSLTPDTGQQVADFFADVIPAGETLNDTLADNVVLQVLILICGIVAIAGGIFALTRTRFDMSMVGAVFGILAMGFLIGAFFALIGLFLVATSRKEFLPECG